MVLIFQGASASGHEGPMRGQGAEIDPKSVNLWSVVSCWFIVVCAVSWVCLCVCACSVNVLAALVPL